jgi:glycosyltransferase involved in cell wall biosynthesis
MKFTVIVPAYNEEKNIGFCLKSLVEQTLKPQQTIVVDDGSTDGTLDVVKKYDDSFHIIRRPKHDRGDFNRYPFVLRDGCKYVNDDFKYLGILDADTVLEKFYYEKIIGFLEAHPRAGIAGGELLHQPYTGKILGSIPYVYGCNRVYTRECWLKINGGKLMKPVPAYDTYHNLYARMLGFQPTRVNSAISYCLRPSRATPPFWKGYTSYQFGYPFWLIVGRSLKNRSIQMLAGYFKAKFSGEKQYPVKQIVKEIQVERIRNMLKL